jgi:TctA family transporter
MEEKKQSPNWFIALGYGASVWFSWMFLFFLFTMSAGTLLAITGIGVKYENYFIYDAIRAIFLISSVIFPMWLVTKNNASNLNKKYIIKDSQKITILALIFMTIIALPLILFASILGPTAPTLLIILVMVIGFITVPEIIFYIASKKYFKNSEDAIVSQQ